MVKDKPISSIFDIAGSDENALTRSFGVILRKDKTLLKKLISLVIGKDYGVSKRLFDNTHFYFEKSHPKGRTDIEIINEKFYIIIESKIGTNEVKIKQANKYARKLNSSKADTKIFIFLTEIGNLNINNKLKSNYPNVTFKNISWEKTLELLKERKQIKVDLTKEYEDYILGGRKMRIFDIDIWAVVVKGKQMVNFDEHNFYKNGKKHKPILIGKREWDKSLGKSVVKELRPVLQIFDKDSIEGKKNGGSYIYKLGKKLKLEKPITNFSQQPAIAKNFNDL